MPMRRSSLLSLCVLLPALACASENPGSGSGDGSDGGSDGGDDGGDGADDGSGDGSGSDDGGDDGDDGGAGHGNCPDAATADPIDGIVHLGRAQWGGSGGFIEIVDVVGDGTTVFACTGTQGMMVWDAAGSGSPQLLSERNGGEYAHPQFPRCQHVGYDFDNDIAVITNRGDEVQPNPFLYKFDISNPGAPMPVVGWQGNQSIEGVAVRGNTIYAAAHTDGLLVFEDQGDAMLTLVDELADADSDAWQPIFADDLLLVAEGHTGLRIYDVSGSPALLSTTALAGSSKDVVVRDQIAFIAASSHIAAVDFSDPEAPAVLDETEAIGTALAVAIGQNETLVTAEWDEIRAYDITDPTDLGVAVSEVVPTTAEFSRVLAIDAVPGDPAGRIYAGEWEGMHSFEQRDCDYGPDIWVSPQTVQFGQVEGGDSESRVVLVHNTGNQTLTIDEVQTTAELSSDTTSIEVEPGKSGVVEITYTSESGSALNGGIGFVSNDIDEPEYALWATGNIAGRDVGDPMPAFDLFDLDGTRWDSADLAGEVVVLAYFATF